MGIHELLQFVQRFFFQIIHNLKSCNIFQHLYGIWLENRKSWCEVLWWECLFVETVCLFVCLSVCLHVCPCVSSHSSETIQQNLKFSVHVGCGHGSVLLWRRCNRLCISGFADKVVFSHTGLYGALCVFLNGESIKTAQTTTSIPTKFCSVIKMISY